MSEVKKITSEEKVWGAISYLWILSLVVLAARKNNDNIRYHANQGFLLFVISLVMFLIPVIGWLINFLIGIVSIFAIIKALQGEKWEIPVVGGYAVKLGDWFIKTVKL